MAAPPCFLRHAMLRRPLHAGAIGMHTHMYMCMYSRHSVSSCRLTSRRLLSTTPAEVEAVQPHKLVVLARRLGPVAAIAALPVAWVVGYVWRWNPELGQVDAAAAAEGRCVVLPDGRWLAYKELGDPNGRPVFVLHDSSSSRLEVEAVVDDGAQARAAGIRLICVDRPGYGGSDALPFSVNPVAQMPQDLIALADDLSIKKFGVIAFTFATPAGLACAYHLPHTHPGRLTAVALVAPIGAEWDKAMPNSVKGDQNIVQWLMRKMPIFSVWMFKGMRYLLFAHPQMYVDSMLNQFKKHPGDSQVATALLADGTKAPWLRAYQEGLRTGVTGWAQDFASFTSKSWGFAPQDVTTDNVSVLLYHGADDAIVPPAWTEYFSSAIRGSVPNICMGEGHLTLVRNRWTAILDAVAYEVPAAQATAAVGAATSAQSKSSKKQQ